MIQDSFPTVYTACFSDVRLKPGTVSAHFTFVSYESAFFGYIVATLMSSLQGKVGGTFYLSILLHSL